MTNEDATALAKIKEILDEVMVTAKPKRKKPKKLVRNMPLHDIPVQPCVWTCDSRRDVAQARVREYLRIGGLPLSTKEKREIESRPYYVLHVNGNSGRNFSWVDEVLYAARIGKIIHFIEKDGYGVIYIPDMLTRRMKAGQVITYGPGCKHGVNSVQTYVDARRVLDDMLHPEARPMPSFR